MGLNDVLQWLNSRGKPAVSPMSGGSTFDIEKKNRNGANLKLRHALRAGGVTRRLQRRSLRLPTRSKSAQTGLLCTTAQAGADPGIFVCRSKFPGLKVGRGS